MSLKPDDNDITPKSNSVKSSKKDQTINYIVYIYNFIRICIDTKIILSEIQKISQKLCLWGHLSFWESDESFDWNVSLQKYRHKITVAIYVMRNLCKIKDLVASYIPHIQNPSNKGTESFNVPLIFTIIRLLMRINSKCLKAEISDKNLYIFGDWSKRETIQCEEDEVRNLYEN